MFVSHSSPAPHLHPMKIAYGLDYLPQGAYFQAKRDIWLCSKKFSLAKELQLWGRKVQNAVLYLRLRFRIASSRAFITE